MRVLYELAHHGSATASELVRRLLLDAGYLSRIVSRFAGQGWINRAPSPTDARQQVLTLTEAGRGDFEPLQQRSREEAAALLAPLPPSARAGLIDALQQAQRLLEAPSAGAAAAAGSAITLRAPRAGDMGWVVEQHGALYAQEYDWNTEFEALVAEIVAGMIRRHDPAWERSWIAELDRGEGPQPVGSVFVVRKSATAIGAALIVWLVLVFFTDLGVIAMALSMRPTPEVLFGLLVLNPLQVFKLGAIYSLRSTLDTLGAVGQFAVFEFGERLPAVLLGLLMAWVLAVFGLSFFRFARQGDL